MTRMDVFPPGSSPRHENKRSAGKLRNLSALNVPLNDMEEMVMPGKKKKSSGRKYGKAAGKTVASAMRRKKRGTLKSGRGGKGGTVKSRKQAIAIGLSEARKKGAKVPRKKSA
jgi:hypothetical protein